MTKTRIIPSEKKCKGCSEIKPISEFHLAPLNRDGHHTNCKTCRSVYMAGHYKQNSDRIKARVTVYTQENSDVVKSRRAVYRAENSETISEYKHAWRIANWEWLRPIYIAYDAAREAHIKLATPAWADRSLILAFYKKANEITATTGIKHNVDHVIPLRGKTVCGLHVHTNLQILTEKANKQKHNKLIIDDMQDAA